MCAEYDDPNDYKAFTTEDREILSKCDCLIIGPGLGRGEEVKKMLRELLADETIWPPTKPLVVDADGLYAMTAPDASLPPPPSARGGKPADKWSADKETMDLFWNLLESRKIMSCKSIALVLLRSCITNFFLKVNQHCKFYFSCWGNL